MGPRELDAAGGSGKASSAAADLAKKLAAASPALRELYGWLEDGGHFYVCGDATRMAKDVDAALRLIIEQQRGRGPEDAVEYVADLKKTKGKYDAVCQDVENKRKKIENSFDHGKTKAQGAYVQQQSDMRNTKVCRSRDDGKMASWQVARLTEAHRRRTLTS